MSDLAARVPQDGLRGLIDHTGRAWRFFDFDPTHMASLQAPSVQDPNRPQVRRPRAASTGPGYAGRKRADAIRTRTAVLLSHAGMWLTGMAQPGNGHRAAFLDHACTQIIALCREVRVELASVLVRADGEFGSLAQIAQIAGHGLGWLVRAKDYATLLRHPDVRAALGRGSGLRMAQSDSPIERELFDVPDLMWRSVDGRREVRTRLVVTRTPWSADLGKPGVGHLHEGFVYELVVTNLPPEAASAAEVVSLYLARGALEATLAQEDREMSTDRWITHRALGQDLFQMISQWVWNHRVVLGKSMISESALRVTPWEVSVTKAEPTPITSMPDGKSTSSDPPAEKSELSAPSDEAVSSTHTEPGGSPSRSKRLGPESFTRDEEGRVHCPSGHRMQLTEVRHRRSGERHRFRAPRAACADCQLVSRCCGSDVPPLQGRVVDLPVAGPCAPPPAPPTPREHSAGAVSPVVASPRPPRRLPVLVNERLVWTDLKACAMRRALVDGPWSEHVEITLHPNLSPPSEPLVTRDQRAHRRATWAQRLARNDLGPDALRLTLEVCGVPDALARLVGLRVGSSSSETRTPTALQDQW